MSSNQAGQDIVEKINSDGLIKRVLKNHMTPLTVTLRLQAGQDIVEIHAIFGSQVYFVWMERKWSIKKNKYENTIYFLFNLNLKRK